ncbi:MAG: D-alanine--D-alanine ligase, partial [Candidatus Omnitrophica bacterium]|nr:D-alanine--D-alanine ligase [Candidatus Omnitrophota bacterium]
MREKKSFKRVGVLMGGSSSERDISLVSGKGVCDALKRKGYEVMPLDVKNENDTPRLINEAGVEAVFIALHGGFGENGTVQKILEDMKVPYTGSGWQASALVMDKIRSKKAMEEKGIPTPPYRTFKNNEYPSSLGGLSLPLIVKPSKQGSSIGVSMVAENDAGLKDGLKKAYAFDFEVIVEEYIDGREIHVGILDDKPLPVVEVVPKSKFYDYQAKYKDSATEYLVPA